MKSIAATVDAFLKEQPEHVRDVLVQIRYMIQTEAPACPEKMHDGGPVYTLSDGTILCGLTAQKHNLVFYVGRVPDEVRETLTHVDFRLGKGTVSFKTLDHKKLRLLRTLLPEAMAKIPYYLSSPNT